MAGLWSGEIEQHHIRALLHSFEGNFAAVRRDVEVANDEIRRKLGEYAPGTRSKIEEPKVLMADFTARNHKRLRVTANLASFGWLTENRRVGGQIPHLATSSSPWA